MLWMTGCLWAWGLRRIGTIVDYCDPAAGYLRPFDQRGPFGNETRFAVSFVILYVRGKTISQVVSAAPAESGNSDPRQIPWLSRRIFFNLSFSVEDTTYRT